MNWKRVDGFYLGDRNVGAMIILKWKLKENYKIVDCTELAHRFNVLSQHLKGRDENKLGNEHTA